MTKRVFLTGASGFVAAHVLHQLLLLGYFVRATVRSQAKADQISAKYPQYKNHLEFVLVDDVAKEGVFDGKLDGFDGIIHTASPFHFKVTTSNKVDLLDPAVKGTTEVLEAAAKVPSIKRIVITSSFAAMRDSTKGPEHVYTESDWNPITQEQAEKGDGRAGYVASKKFAEKAAFDFVTSRKPQFDIVTLNPPIIFGPIEHHVDKLSDLNESIRQFYDCINGSGVALAPFGLYADVRDVAAAHILAYEKSEPNQRYFITNGNFTWQEVEDAAHKSFPGQTKAKVSPPAVSESPKLQWDNSKSRTKLGLVYHTKEETFRDTIAQLIELEKQGK